MKRLIILFIISMPLFGQTLDENWLPLSRTSQGTVYLNTEGIIEYNNGDIYAWVLQEHASPIVIESVDGRIHKTKTYYLFNKELRRYSFQQIIYYDDEGNVLKSFSYQTKAKLQPYRYNYPIMENTNEELVYSKILELLGEKKKEKGKE